MTPVRGKYHFKYMKAAAYADLENNGEYPMSREELQDFYNMYDGCAFQ